MKVSKDSFTHHGIIANGDIFVPNWDEIERCDEMHPKYNKAKELMSARDSFPPPYRLMFRWDSPMDHEGDPELVAATGYSLTWVDEDNRAIMKWGPYFENWFIKSTILETNMLIREVLEDLVRPKTQKISRSW
jgi:hypothetical protein